MGGENHGLGCLGRPQAWLLFTYHSLPLCSPEAAKSETIQATLGTASSARGANCLENKKRVQCFGVARTI